MHILNSVNIDQINCVHETVNNMLESAYNYFSFPHQVCFIYIIEIAIKSK